MEIDTVVLSLEKYEELERKAKKAEELEIVNEKFNNLKDESVRLLFNYNEITKEECKIYEQLVEVTNENCELKLKLKSKKSWWRVWG